MTDVGTTGVTHAMITADGRAVPITIHPETGAYMTPDGQTLVTQEVDGQQVCSKFYKFIQHNSFFNSTTYHHYD